MQGYIDGPRGSIWIDKPLNTGAQQVAYIFQYVLKVLPQNIAFQVKKNDAGN
jgi:hypothetical protein